MTYNTPKDLSNEELLKTKKRLKIVLYIVIVIFILSYLGIFLINKIYHNFTIFIIPMILISPICFNLKSLDRIRKELKSRNINL